MIPVLDVVEETESDDDILVTNSVLGSFVERIKKMKKEKVVKAPLRSPRTTKAAVVTPKEKMK